MLSEKNPLKNISVQNFWYFLALFVTHSNSVFVSKIWLSNSYTTLAIVYCDCTSEPNFVLSHEPWNQSEWIIMVPSHLTLPDHSISLQIHFLIFCKTEGHQKIGWLMNYIFKHSIWSLGACAWKREAALIWELTFSLWTLPSSSLIVPFSSLIFL